jgi:hypothetical protein
MNDGIGSMRALSCVFVLLVVGCSSAPAVEEMVVAGNAQVVSLPVLELETGSRADSLGLSAIGAVVEEPAGFLLSDVLNDRVLRIDTTFHLLGAFGRPGEGPGELDGPLRIVLANEQIVVGDQANDRFAIFDLDGGFVRVVPSDHASFSFAVRSDGRIVATAPGETHYGRLIEPNGVERPFLDRPRSFVRAAARAEIGMMDASVLVGPGDTAHVFDDQLGLLLKYDPNGRFIVARSLPAEVAEEARKRRRELTAEFAQQGRRLVGAPFLKTMRFTPDGRILLLVTQGDLVALLVDPGDYRYTRISAALADPDMIYVRTATDVAVRGDLLYAFSQYGLSVHPLGDR